MIQLDTQIRLGTLDDHPFILDSWVKSMAQLYPNNYDKEFRTKYHQYVSKLLNKCLVMVSHLVDEPDQIISYIVFTGFHQKLIVHYAYTKIDARRQGKVNELMRVVNPENHLIVFTHACRNENVMKLFVKKFVYDPGILELI